MKFILLLLLSSSIFADGFYSSAFLSYNPLNTETAPYQGEQYTTNMLVGYEWKGVYFEAEQQTNTEKGSSFYFAPFREEYYTRAGYRYKKVYVEFDHLCIHGVEQKNPGGGYDRFTIGFDSRGFE